MSVQKKKQKLCIKCNKIHASYGKESQRPTHCVTCKNLEEDKHKYWSVKKAMCIGLNEDGTKCNKVATTGLPGTKIKDRKYCSKKCKRSIKINRKTYIKI